MVGVPEGSVIQIDPVLNPDDFGLSDAARIIFKALQEYGAVNVDNARGNVIYGEGLYGHPDKSWEGILEDNEFEKVPLNCYRILKINNIINMGDSTRKP